MTIEERKILAQEPIIWKGDLSDDCTALWGGLMLRAEWMDQDYWWWAVSDLQKGEIIIQDSNEYLERFIGGETARKKAESVAIDYINRITQEIKAKYLIADTFKITGRGLVLSGQILEGVISTGDTIEFPAEYYLRQRRIIGVEGIRKSPPDEINTGILIRCKNDAEIDELRNWKSNNTVAIVYETLEAINDQIHTDSPQVELKWWQKLFK